MTAAAVTANTYMCLRVPVLPCSYASTAGLRAHSLPGTCPYAMVRALLLSTALHLTLLLLLMMMH